MRKLKKFILACGLVSAATSALATDSKEIGELVKFLTSKELLGPSGEVPTSYYIGQGEDIAKYFGDYICSMDNTCSVVDTLYTKPYAILGRGLPPNQGTKEEIPQAQAQIERTDMKYGADIYDAATWQIALALAAEKGHLDKDQARKLIANQTRTIMEDKNRATNEAFKYGYKKPITSAKKAFTFRMIAKEFQNKDPFFESERYKDYVSWDYDPKELAKNDPGKHQPDFFEYVSTWSDWKPITGENAWAQLLGPLQAEALLNNGKVAAHSVALTNAIDSLYAFSTMQAGIGAFYYAPGGSEGNQGPIPQGEISIENNFSVLGGLQTLAHILKNTEQTPEVKQALLDVNTMLYGGKTVNGFETLGLLSFLYNGAFDKENGHFYTHGTAVNPASTKGWQPDRSRHSDSLAVDINTWGISALGVETIEKWYGEGTALRIWQDNVVKKGGYYNNGELWGVGYTLNNNSGQDAEKIMSTEWTAGAISTLYSLIEYRKSKGLDYSELDRNLRSMREGIRHLRNDNYLAANFDGETPESYYFHLPASAGQAYLYASKRFAIPFGWNANTLPSTTSNAWVIMNEYRFNPFQYLGKLSGEDYPTPKKVDIEGGDTPVKGDELPKAVKIKFMAGKLGPITKLALSYKINESSEKWLVSAEVEQREGLGSLPAKTRILSISFYNNGWAGACQLKPATKICKDVACNEVKTIVAHWSPDGTGPCDVE